MAKITGPLLLKAGFVMVGETDGYEFMIKQYGGYHDYVYFNLGEKRIDIQYKMNNIEVFECDYEKANKALELAGLPSMFKLQKDD